MYCTVCAVPVLSSPYPSVLIVHRGARKYIPRKMRVCLIRNSQLSSTGNSFWLHRPSMHQHLSKNTCANLTALPWIASNAETKSSWSSVLSWDQERHKLFILGRAFHMFSSAFSTRASSLWFRFQKPITSSTTSSKNGTFRQQSSSSFNPISWYAEKLESHPLTTKCITSGIIAGSADVICQYIVHSDQESAKEGTGPTSMTAGNETFAVDWVRTGRFTLLGFGLVAPVVHKWYGFLMKRIPGTSTVNVLKRLFCDQALFAPIFISTFMTSLMALEGKDLKQVPRVLENELATVVVTNWSLWIPAMYLNFRYIPVQWQVLYSNCVGLVWNIYLSWKTQEDMGNDSKQK